MASNDSDKPQTTIRIDSTSAGEIHVGFPQSLLVAAKLYLRSKGLPVTERASRGLLRKWAREGMAQRSMEFLDTLEPGTMVEIARGPSASCRDGLSV